MDPVYLSWDPFNQIDPGPCIKVMVTNSDETLDAWRDIGFEPPKPHEITALLDTGSPFTIVSSVYAKNQMLFATSAQTEIRTLAGNAVCGEHSGAIGFPNTSLKRIGMMRILSRDFGKERYYSCLIGRDVLRFWKISFDGRKKLITIVDHS
jgi:hypothetical protein